MDWIKRILSWTRRVNEWCCKCERHCKLHAFKWKGFYYCYNCLSEMVDKELNP